MHKRLFLFLCLGLVLCLNLSAAIINVPADQATIQAAVNAATAGDEILVANGTYNESVNLATGPAGITIRAVNPGMATVDGGAGSAFRASNHAGDITIAGFVLQSNGTTDGVVLMVNLNGLLTILNNTVIAANSSHGVLCENSTAIPTRCALLDNVFSVGGNRDCINILAGEDNVGGDANIVISGNSNTGSLLDDAITIQMEGNNQFGLISITDNTFGPWTGSGSGIELFMARGAPTPVNGEMHFLVDNNVLNGPDGVAINIDFDGVGHQFFGVVSNNTITGNGVDLTTGINFDDDSTSDGISVDIRIEDNDISGTADSGIKVRPFNDAANTNTYNVVIDGNTIDNPNADDTGTNQGGIILDASSGADDENYVANLEVTNNTVTNLDVANATCILIARPTTTTVATAVVNYLESGNSCAATLSGSPTASTDPVSASRSLASLGGFVWNDQNGNGAIQGSEPGVPGVEIAFTGGGIAGSTVTDGDGNYQIPALLPGTFNLTITPTADLPNLTQAGGDNDFNPMTAMASVTLAAGGGDQFRAADGGLTSMVASVPEISVNATGNLDFGEVLLGAAAVTKTYTITNTGTVAVNNLVISSNLMDFAASGLSATSLPNNGNTATFQVAFAPTTAGNKSAEISITFTDGTTMSFMVTGEGLLPRARNLTIPEDYLSLKAAVDAASAGDEVVLLQDVSEIQINMIQALTVDGGGFTLTNTDGRGFLISGAMVTLKNIIIEQAQTFGIIATGDNLTMTDVEVNNSQNTGIAITCLDGAVLTDITAKNNGGNGISITNCQNVTLTGVTTEENSFGTFGAGVGVFNSDRASVGCNSTDSPTNNVTITGIVDISERPAYYTQAGDGATVGPTVNYDPADGSPTPDNNFEVVFGDDGTVIGLPTLAEALVFAAAAIANPAGGASSEQIRAITFVRAIANGKRFVRANIPYEGGMTESLSIQPAIQFAPDSGETIIEISGGAYPGNVDASGKNIRFEFGVEEVPD